MTFRVACMLALVSVAAQSAAAAPAPAPAATTAAAKSQAVKAEDVLIQGKLYSPSALFILTRPVETFGRDAVVPHYLNATPAMQLGGSQLVPAVLLAHTKSAAVGVTTATTPGGATPR